MGVWRQLGRMAVQKVKNDVQANVRGGWTMSGALRAQKEIKREQLARAQGSGWYSKYRSDDGKIHVMLDATGQPTTKYPHVHVIHDEQAGEVRIVISRGRGVHSDLIRLPGDAGGNEVDAAIARLLRKL